MMGASTLGGRLFRNNSGIAFHKNGDVVRYGLASPGGSDLIGWMPHTVTAEDVGRRLAIFCAIEGKWGSTRATDAQRQFLAVVESHGGIAILGKHPDEILRILKEWK